MSIYIDLANKLYTQPQSSQSNNNNKSLESKIPMQQDHIISTSTKDQLQQIFTYVRTFRKHPLILMGNVQVSPYYLALNGFVNKNFKGQQKNQRSVQGSNCKIRQLVCVCRIPQCLKIIKLNNFEHQKYQDNMTQDDFDLLLSQHEECCTFYKKQTQKVSVNDLFHHAATLYQNIFETYNKAQHSLIDRLNIDWGQLKNLISPSLQNKSNILLECYKVLDKRLSIFQKNCTKSILLSVFGWKFASFKQPEILSLKCHFCGKKHQHEMKDQFDFYKGHNPWCLVLNEHQIWKLILKRTYSIKTKQTEQIKEKNLYIIPHHKQAVQAKQIRSEVYDFVKPTLQRLNNLTQNSQTLLKNLKKPNNQDRQYQKQIRQESQIWQKLKPLHNLDQITKKCKEIIKTFINSIELRQN